MSEFREPPGAGLTSDGAQSGARESATTSPEVIDESRLVRELRAVPDLLVRHPALLEVLQVPHGIGGATSLIEHQVRVLRGRNAEIAGRLDGLLENARDNERISQQLHELALGMLGVTTAADMLGLVYATLHERFGAERTAVRIWADPPRAERGCGEFVGADAASAPALDACMDGGRPVCGRPDPLAVDLLFPDGDPPGSWALIPTVGASLRGVLALASPHSDRFSAGSGTLFLSQLGDLLTHSLLRVLR